MRFVRRQTLGTALMWAWCLACDAGSAPWSGLDAGIVDVEALDGALDSGPHATPDAKPDAFVGGEPDAGVDAAGPDGSLQVDGEVTCGACQPTSTCELVACIAGECARDWAPDGLSCGEDDSALCVRGVCSARGCGDGYREREARREGCDDGNRIAGDGCEPSCAPEPFALDEVGEDAPRSYPTPQGAFAATDGLGRTLFVWTSVLGGEKVVRARLVAASDDSQAPAAWSLSAPGGAEPEPVVVGLEAGGFLVAWSQKSSAGTRVLVRNIAADGTPRDARALSQVDSSLQTSPRLSLLGGGAVLVFRDRAGRVLAQRLGADGRVVGDEVVVSASASDTLDMPRVAAHGEHWIVAWRRRPSGAGAAPRLLARRFLGATVVDVTPLTLTDDVSSASIASLADGFVVAWASGHEDGLGNVYATTVPLEGALDVGKPVGVAVDEARADVEPSVVAFGRGYLVCWMQGELGLPALHFSDMVDVPELSLLVQRWARGAEGGLSISPGPSGAWLGWRGVDGGSLRPTASAFFLPDS